MNLEWRSSGTPKSPKLPGIRPGTKSGPGPFTRTDSGSGLEAAPHGLGRAGSWGSDNRKVQSANKDLATRALLAGSRFKVVHYCFILCAGIHLDLGLASCISGISCEHFVIFPCFMYNSVLRMMV